GEIRVDTRSREQQLVPFCFACFTCGAATPGRAVRKGWFAPVNITAIGHSAIANGWPPGTRSPADDARLQRYDEYNAYADGWQHSGNKPDALTFNYARTLLRKTVSYVFNAPVGIHIPASNNAVHNANLAERQLLGWRD